MNAHMTSFYHDHSSDSINCEVVFRGTEIAVSYDDDDGYGRKVVYSGRRIGSESWLLECKALNARATLSRSPIDPDCLEGSWSEKGYNGMWMIDLETDD